MPSPAPAHFSRHLWNGARHQQFSKTPNAPPTQDDSYMQFGLIITALGDIILPEWYIKCWFPRNKALHTSCLLRDSIFPHFLPLGDNSWQVHFAFELSLRNVNSSNCHSRMKFLHSPGTSEGRLPIAWLSSDLWVYLDGPSKPAKQVVLFTCQTCYVTRNARLSPFRDTPGNHQATPESQTW